jgi:hypothetical protein
MLGSVFGHGREEVAGQKTMHCEEHHDFVTASETVNGYKIQRGGDIEDM